jgi:VanZ family protein
MVLFVIYSSLTSSPVTIDVKFSDKILHVVGYFALTGWFIQIYHTSKMRYLLVTLFISMGIGLEFLQDLGGDRYFEVQDMLANTTGVLLAWLLVKTPFPGLLYWLENRFLKTSV